MYGVNEQSSNNTKNRGNEEDEGNNSPENTGSLAPENAESEMDEEEIARNQISP